MDQQLTHPEHLALAGKKQHGSPHNHHPWKAQRADAAVAHSWLLHKQKSRGISRLGQLQVQKMAKKTSRTSSDS